MVRRRTSKKIKQLIFKINKKIDQLEKEKKSFEDVARQLDYKIEYLYDDRAELEEEIGRREEENDL
jgi:hypothetical protein